jgi:hypothetical protein
VDVLRSGLRDSLRRAIKTIPGQGSGLSYIYFLIVAGNEDGVKADKMVTRFVAKAPDVPNVAPELAEDLVRKASALRSYRGTGEDSFHPVEFGSDRNLLASLMQEPIGQMAFRRRGEQRTVRQVGWQTGGGLR